MFCFFKQTGWALTCEYNFPRHKDEQDNSGFDHSVNESWKQLRLVAAKHKSVILVLKKQSTKSLTIIFNFAIHMLSVILKQTKTTC